MEYGRIFFLRFDHSENVRDIFFLRQLSHDEAARKVTATHCNSVIPWHHFFNLPERILLSLCFNAMEPLSDHTT